MKIAVVGGSGYLGTRLVDALAARGHDVRAIATSPGSLAPHQFHAADVRDAGALARAFAGTDCVINLAAHPGDDPGTSSLVEAVNVDGMRNVVQAMTANGVARLVFLSTVAVYGLDQPLAHESAPLRPFNAYGRSKRDAEAIAQRWADADPARSLVVVRPSVVFGEGNRGNVYTLIDHLRRGRFVMVGDGANRKSIAYAGNLVDFVCTRVASPPGTHVINYADKPDLTTRELIAKIRALLPPGREPARVPYALALAGGHACDALAAVTGRHFAISAERVRKFCAETTVATGTLDAAGFVPRCSLDEALTRTVASILAEEP